MPSRRSGDNDVDGRGATFAEEGTISMNFPFCRARVVVEARTGTDEVGFVAPEEGSGRGGVTVTGTLVPPASGSGEVLGEFGGFAGPSFIKELTARSSSSKSMSVIVTYAPVF